MKEIRRYYLIAAEPKDIYNALTNKNMLEIWTGEDAEMEPVPGTEFSLWGGSITGVNMSFEEDRKLVQQWFFGEQEEPSVVTIVLHPDKKGTSVELRHTNIPDDAFDNISEGWDEDYFGALKELFI
ncbi:ATPase [Mariniphaga sediminis]|uniref:ATPase n=1 Tax=Mariniphaga sediminis TaxID=1628158 RepID=A0A399D2X8_9BACT|nr:SRPBCC domain-containing protein [Mariniphaga sediminis]RIH64750.1 ATPase [Mariniphaga sediminis]